MKILMTNHRLASRGGSELFVVETATALRRAGHDICVFTPLPGPVAEPLRAAGVPVVKDPAECPFKPDIIHGQHHMETMAALCLWPDVPAIYFVHGETPWEEAPPVHPRIRRYLATSPRFAISIPRQCGVSADHVVTVRNFFDATRFRRVRPRGFRTGRALIFPNTMAKDGPAARNLREACQVCGYVLDSVGQAFGRTVEAPEEILPDYDVVFAAGRSAIEAMACGCAVIPVTSEQSTDLVTPENYEEMADRNFTAEINAPPLSSTEVAAQIALADPEKTDAVTRRIREEATLNAALATMLRCYGAVIAEGSVSPDGEVPALGSYLLGLAARIKDADERRAALVDEKQRAIARAAKWKARAETTRNHLAWIEQQCTTGGWWRRRWWRRLRREWEMHEKSK